MGRALGALGEQGNPPRNNRQHQGQSHPKSQQQGWNDNQPHRQGRQELHQ